MRQIFSSPRLENVEGVARLLAEHGIETYTSQSRSYKGTRRRSFSYSKAPANADTQPGVWVVRADQLVEAREVLREAGLLQSPRDSYLPASRVAVPEDAPARTPAQVAARVRRVLLIVVAVLAALTSMRMVTGG